VRRAGYIAVVIVGAGTSLAVWAQSLVMPADVKWINDPDRPGIQWATLVGDSSKPGPYTRRIKLAAHTTVAPHWHPEERHVTTLSGTWYIGFGTVVDRSRATKMVPGTFLRHPAKLPHFEFTTDEEVVVQVSGIGPTATEYVK
jgi:hypothetical protein